jgi:hypothetical protein
VTHATRWLRRTLAALCCGTALCSGSVVRAADIPGLAPVAAAPVPSTLPAGWAQRGVFM